MTDINGIVLDQSIVYIINRNPDIIASAIFRNFHRLGIDQVGKHDSSNLLFQDLVGGDLKIVIDGKRHVVALLRFYRGVLQNIQDFSHVVDHNLFLSVGSLQGQFHILLQSGLSDHRIGAVAVFLFLRMLFRILRVQIVQFRRGRAAGIADQRREINSVIVNTNRILLDRYSLKSILIFRNRSHRLIADIRRHSHRKVFLIGSQRELITNNDDLQPFLFCEVQNSFAAFIDGVGKPVLLKILSRIGIILILRIGIQSESLWSGQICDQCIRA